MPVTLEQVRAQLDRIEPNYNKAAQLGVEAIPHLEQLAKSNDVILAPRAVYLASLIGGERAARLLLSAAQSPFVEVRIQAAAGARNLRGEAATRILTTALDDSDFGVRKFALRSTNMLFSKDNVPGELQKKIDALSKLANR